MQRGSDPGPTGQEERHDLSRSRVSFAQLRGLPPSRWWQEELVRRARASFAMVWLRLGAGWDRLRLEPKDGQEGWPSGDPQQGGTGAVMSGEGVQREAGCLQTAPVVSGHLGTRRGWAGQELRGQGGGMAHSPSHMPQGFTRPLTPLLQIGGLRALPAPVTRALPSLDTEE